MFLSRHAARGPAIAAVAALVALVACPSLARAQVEGDPRDERRDPRDLRRPGSAPATAPLPVPTRPMTLTPGDDEATPEVERPPLPAPMPRDDVALEEPLDPDSYICGRGDVFELNFWGQQNLKQRVTVDMEGRAFIARVGYVDVRDKTLTQTRAIIRKAVLRYYPGLHFDLSLVTPRTFLVHVVENVGTPGTYPATALDRVDKVLQRAGGVRGSVRRIELRRRDDSRALADLLRYRLTGDTTHNPTVMDGDVIRVPTEGLMVTVRGPVFRPGRYELTGGKDLAEVVDLAGGLRPMATRRLPIRVLRRGEDGHSEVVEVSFDAAGELPRVPLRDDDEIVVQSAEVFKQAILLVGAIADANAADEATSIKRVAFFPGDTVRSVIERAGGLSASADLSHAYIRRGDQPSIPVDLEALLIRRDLSADKPLVLGDSVVVPYQRRSVLVEGGVVRPGAYPYNPNFRLEEYIAVAGGIAHNGKGIGSARRITTSGKTIDYAPGLQITSGDTIVVPERGFTRAETAQLIMGGVGLLLSTMALAFAVTQ